MKKNTFIYKTVLLCTMLTLTACSSKSGSSQVMATTAAYAEDVYEMENLAQETASFESGGSSGTAKEQGLTDTVTAGQTLPAGRKLIRNVNMEVETDAFDQLLKTLTDQIGVLGGYVEQSNISGNSLNQRNEAVPRYALLTIRLPIDKLNGFITTVESNGNVTSKAESTQDVTLQYSDLESRKKSLAVEQERIWALLEKADTLESVIALEERLSQIRYELESMESQLRLYDNQVEYSTLTLYVNEIKEAAAFTPTSPETPGQRIQSGFTKNLNAIAHWFTGLIVCIIAGSPIWLPLAAVVGAGLLISRRIRRRGLKSKYKNSDSQSKTPEEGAEK